MGRYEDIENVLFSLDRATYPMSSPGVPARYGGLSLPQAPQRQPTVHVALEDVTISQGFMEVMDAMMRLSNTRGVDIQLYLDGCRFGRR